jgi:hypothetical protein
VLNRAALILRYKQPFVDWINVADPSPTSHTLTLAEVNQEHAVYLVEVEDEDELAEWLARHHEALFEEELRGWYTDPALWPRDGRSRCSRSGVRSSSTPSCWIPVSLRSRTMSSKNERCSLTRNPWIRVFGPHRSKTPITLVTCGLRPNWPPVRSVRIAFLESPSEPPPQPEWMRSESDVLKSHAERLRTRSRHSICMASESNAGHSLTGPPKRRWPVSIARRESPGQAHDRSF